MDATTSPMGDERSRSIEDLEGIVWSPPTLHSYVAGTSHALRRKPIASLTDEELRVGLEQQVGVAYLVPLAIQRLQSDPLAEARLYRGDLLQSLLDVPASFWQEHEALRLAAAGLAKAAMRMMVAEPEPDVVQRDIFDAVTEAYLRFNGTIPSRAWLRPEDGKAPPPVTQRMQDSPA
ncbi:MAG: contact-dependent growth inhibition system immunity protein [Acetobacteraceae bacterium]|nr:contact-dependent growth inhibition system immunity protein [Acetobacteraceae bacterium]